jgi:sulfur-oxidizing protein SoxZ
MGNMKIKAKLKGDVVGVKVLAKHDMLTYDQAKKKGVKANFITHITAKVGDRIVYDVSTSQFWSKNPQFKFKFKGGKKGEKVTITWTDLSGKTVTESKKIK